VSGLVFSRLLVWAAALWAVAAFGVVTGASGPLDPGQVTQPFGSALANVLVAPAARYDSVWYLWIAHAGYAFGPAAAFFPLLPLLLAAGGWLTGSALAAGVVVSLAALGAAVWGLYRLTELELGAAAARASVLILLFFPTALYLSAVYTESLFLALSVGSVYAGRRGRWAVAGVLGGLASATRSSGVLLVLPLGLMMLYGPARPPARWWVPARWRWRGSPSRSVLWLALVPAGMLAFMGYLALRYGSPLAPFRVESYWGRSFAGPFGGVVQAVGGLPRAVAHVLGGTQRQFAPGAPLGWQAYQLIDVGFLGFAAAGLWFCWRRLPWAYTAYALVLVCQALSYPMPSEPMGSFSRYLLGVFPVFMGWGAVLALRPVARWAVLASLAAGLVVFSGLWGVWAWVA
jgi:hypothetical protein